MRLPSMFKEAATVLAYCAILPIIKLLIVLVCVVEMIAWVFVALWSIDSYSHHASALVFLCPVGLTVVIFCQVNLWHYYWLKAAHSNHHARALGEYFCSALRYDVTRRPHPWE
jgi:hypothetical protein